MKTKSDPREFILSEGARPLINGFTSSLTSSRAKSIKRKIKQIDRTKSYGAFC